MKKVNLILVALFVLLTSYSSKAQSFEKGRVTISAGYGIGNLSKALLSTYKTQSGYKASFVGPLFAKVEYAVSDKIGLGLNVAHMGAKASWTDGSDYVANLTTRSTSIMGRMNLHFFTNDKFDAYWGAGIGYKLNKFEITDNNPEADPLTIPNYFPLAFETTVGARYFFVPNVGVYAEAGIAKAALQFGLVGKF